MSIAFIGTVIIALVVLAFVLEPILRARSDAVVLDSIAMPELDEPNEDDPLDTLAGEESPEADGTADDRAATGRISIDRAASSDAS